MAPQAYEWTCSICSLDWVVNALANASGQVPHTNRQEVANIIGVPECVNATYGLMSTQCMQDAMMTFGLESVAAWVTFDQAYAIMRQHTGVINPQGMYHFMGCRGVLESELWVANSALNYCGVWDTLSRSQFNALGPVQIIYLPQSVSSV